MNNVGAKKSMKPLDNNEKLSAVESFKYDKKILKLDNRGPFILP